MILPPRDTAAYRADIDGLRALAVVGVLLFHARIPGFGGGYVGVDVFFVISGYLITRLLTAPGRPSLAEFYLRRGRRILPALLAMALVTAVAACVLLMPWELRRFGKYLAAVPLMVGNLPPWTEGSGYFDRQTTPSALLHLWSIAVEEQFYLLYPVTLLAIGAWLPRRRRLALAVIAAVSLAACVWASYHRPAANFYLAPSRAWELLLGALLAMWPANALRCRPAGEWLAAFSLVGLALIIHGYGDLPRYPGLYTIAPCAATAALILTGQRPTRVSRLLSTRPLVFTGLISYSLYLWHLPILVLAGYFHIRPFGVLESLGLLGIAYGVAAASWRLVERPIRSRSFLASSRSFVSAAIVADVVVLAAGLVLWNSDGFPGRFPAELSAPDTDWIPVGDGILKCVDLQPRKIARGELCSYGHGDDGAPSVLVWGDSHAIALWAAYEELANSHHVRVYLAMKSACRPLPGFTNRTYAAPKRAACLSFNDAVVKAIQRLRPALVILNAHWIDTDSDLTDDRSLATDMQPPGDSSFRAALDRTLGNIGSEGRSICAVLDVPTYDYDVPYALGMARKRGISEDFLKLTRKQALAQYRGPERDFRQLEREGRLRVVDPKDILCAGEMCAYEMGGDVLYGDTNHLSTRGGRRLTSTLEGCFQDLDSRRRSPLPAR